MAKHTPGPWDYDEGSHNFVVYHDDGEPNPYGIASVFNQTGDEQNRANARLIAAAPDLLRVLKHAVRWHDQLHESDVDLMEAAITKAEGR